MINYLHNIFGTRPFTRDFFFTIVWGMVGGTLTALLQPYYREDNDGSGWDLLILGGSRYVAIVLTNITFSTTLSIGEHEVVVRGPVGLRSLDPEHAGLLDLVHVLLLEFVEAGAALVAGGLIRDETSGYFASFGFMALADFMYGLIRARITDPHYAYYMADDTGAPVRYVAALFRRGATDAVFYTVMLFGWSSAMIRPEDGLGSYIFGVAWVLRNVLFRTTRWLVWEKLFKGTFRGIFPDNRRPLTVYGVEEYNNVYISENRSHQAFVWDWRSGVREIDDLSELLWIRENYLDVNAYAGTNSWEEFRDELIRPRALVEPSILDDEHSSDDDVQGIGHYDRHGNFLVHQNNQNNQNNEDLP